MRQQRLRDFTRRPRLHQRPAARPAGQLLHRLGQAGAAADPARRQAGRGRWRPGSATPTAWAFARRGAHGALLRRRLDAGVDDLRDPAGRPLRLGGPKAGQPPDLPLVYLPRGLDNSSGGQDRPDDGRWGPLQGQMLHFSFGTGTHFLVLREQVDGQPQGAVVPLPGEFLSGVAPRAVQPQGRPALRLGDGRLGHLHTRRRLLPARPLHRRPGAAPGRLPRPRERRARDVPRPLDRAVAERPEAASSPRRGTTATAPLTARPSSRRGTPACRATTRWRSARRTSSPTAGRSSSKCPTCNPSASSTSTCASDSAPPHDLFAHRPQAGGRPSPGSPATARRRRRSRRTRSWPTWCDGEQAGAEPVARADLRAPGPSRSRPART